MCTITVCFHTFSSEARTECFSSGLRVCVIAAVLPPVSQKWMVHQRGGHPEVMATATHPSSKASAN